jgi:hypothetical protein
MCETTTKTRKPQARSAKVVHLGDAVILWITVDKNTTAYRVTALPHAFGKAAFHLQKADKGDGEPEEYDVLLDGPFSSCECKGFLRHGMKAAGGTGCKHIAGCQAAVNAGQLQATPKPQQAALVPKPQPEEKPATPAQHLCPECRRWGDNPFCPFCPI